MQHLDEGTLQTWLDRERAGLDPSELAAIQSHLTTCDECAKRLEELEALDGRAHALLGVGAQASDPATPPFEDVVQRARGTKNRQRALSRIRSMAWAASIVLALGVGWMTNDIYRGGAPEMEAPAMLPGAGQERASASDAPPAELNLQSNESAPAARRREAAALTEAAQAAPESLPGPVADAGQAFGDLSDDGPEQVARADEQLERASVVADTDVVASTAEEERQAAGLGGAASVPQEPAAAAAPEPAAARAAPPEVDRRLATSIVEPSAANSVIVTGRVEDGRSGEPVARAQVFVDGLDVGALSDENGRYQLVLPVTGGADLAAYEITAQRLGFRTELRQVAAGPGDSVAADFSMQEEAVVLQELVVTGNQTADIIPLGDWRPSTLPRAQEETRIPGRYVRGLELLSVETTGHPDTGTPLVRIRQRLDNGGVLTLVEGRAGGERDAWPVESAGAVESRRIDDVLVTATAAVTPEELRALLAAVR